MATILTVKTPDILKEVSGERKIALFKLNSHEPFVLKDLKRAGNNFSGICCTNTSQLPFHGLFDEDTSTLTIHRDASSLQGKNLNVMETTGATSMFAG